MRPRRINGRWTDLGMYQQGWPVLSLSVDLNLIPVRHELQQAVKYRLILLILVAGSNASIKSAEFTCGSTLIDSFDSSCSWLFRGAADCWAFFTSGAQNEKNLDQCDLNQYRIVVVETWGEPQCSF